LQISTTTNTVLLYRRKRINDTNNNNKEISHIYLFGRVIDTFYDAFIDMVSITHVVGQKEEEDDEEETVDCYIKKNTKETNTARIIVM
jgi:hypothetical protein